MKHTQALAWFVASLIVIGLLAGCSLSTLKIGMVETHLPGRWEASYMTFTGTEMDRVQVDEEVSLILDYGVDIDKGNLSIEVRDPAGKVLWDATLREDAGDVVQLPLARVGSYKIVIDGADAGGAFDLSWELQ